METISPRVTLNFAAKCEMKWLSINLAKSNLTLSYVILIEQLLFRDKLKLQCKQFY